jgi:antitoxin ParD1/3/4
MTTLTISLPDSLKEFIDREVEAKGYGNVSEYVRGLLRQAQANEAGARLEALLIEGLAKGKDIPLSPKFWSELHRDAASVLARHKRPGKARPRLRKIA